MQPSPVFMPGESHGQRNMAGYGPWGHKELDTDWSNLAHTPLLTGSCLPGYLLSHSSLLRHCGQTGLPAFPCVTKHLPCSLCWLLLTVHISSASSTSLTKLSWPCLGRIPQSLSAYFLQRTGPSLNWSCLLVLLAYHLLNLSFQHFFSLSTHKLIQSLLRVETLMIYCSLNLESRIKSSKQQIFKNSVGCINQFQKEPRRAWV